MEADPGDLEHLSHEAFAVFMRERSLRIPFESLWNVIKQNKHLISHFNELASNEWWRKKAKHDFYDFYDACIERSDKTVKQFYLNWMRDTIKIHQNLWSKPWKLVYMVCYGTYIMITQNEQSVTFESLRRFSENDPFGALSTEALDDMDIELTDTNATVTSWITKEPITEFEVQIEDVESTGVVRLARNTILVENDIIENVIYRRDTNTTTTTTLKLDVLTTTQTSNLFLSVQGSFTYITHKDRLDTNVIIPTLKRKIGLIGLNYYHIGETIFEWPQNVVDVVHTYGYSLTQILGPYNFSTNKFVYVFENSSRRLSLANNDNTQLFTTKGKLLIMNQYSYCFEMFDSERQDRLTLMLPNGKFLRVEKRDYKNYILGVCGPFVRLARGNKFAWTVDLWSSLQELRKSPIEFISSQHCHNCGLIASITCDTCNSTFCSDHCALQVIDACKHNS